MILREELFQKAKEHSDQNELQSFKQIVKKCKKAANKGQFSCEFNFKIEGYVKQ